MKIRSGFVANSSSSSYVLALGSIKKENIKKLIDHGSIEFKCFQNSDFLDNDTVKILGSRNMRIEDNILFFEFCYEEYDPENDEYLESKKFISLDLSKLEPDEIIVSTYQESDYYSTVDAEDVEDFYKRNVNNYSVDSYTIYD